MESNEDCDTQLITEWPVVNVHCHKSSMLLDKNGHDDKISASHYQNHEFIQNHENVTKSNTGKRKSENTCIHKDPKLHKTKGYALSAKAVLAKWWRISCKTPEHSVQQLPVKLTAESRLVVISRLPSAQEFMTQEVHRLLSELQPDLDPHDASTIHTNLAWFYDKLCQGQKAMCHLEEALKINSQDKEAQWRKIKLQRQLDISHIQQERLQDIPSHLSQCTNTQVERCNADALSMADFFTKYALTHTPVIITDLAEHLTRVPWTLDYIRSIAGECQVTTKRAIPESVEWAKLEPYKTVTVAQFLDCLQSPASRNDDSKRSSQNDEKLSQYLYKSDVSCGSDSDNVKQYLFDWSLPLNCPQLAADLTIPKYFAIDFLQRTSPDSLYRDSWPSLFIAPPDITSELHVDSFASNFWMALFHGSKRWTFYPPKDAPLLYPQYHESMDPVFDVDLSHPDYTRHPLLRMASPYQCVLQAGEVLFVPAGCPHRVENLSTSIAISANFVDASNFAKVKDELDVNRLIDPRAEDLYQEFCDPKFDDSMDMEIGHLKWEQFKRNKTYSALS